MRLFIALMMLFASNIYAATIEVPCAGDITTSLQSAVTAANTSDIVHIGAGSCTAGNVSWENKNITVQGDGIGITNVTGLSFTVKNDIVPQFRISSMSVGAAPQWRVNAHNRTTGGKGWRIDHISFGYPNCGQNIAIQVYGINWGLIDGNQFNNAGNAIFVTAWAEGTSEVNPWPPTGTPGMGGNSWLLPLDFGTDNSLYVENNTFSMDNGCFFGIGDMYYGGRMVFRHNTVTNAYWQNHAARSYERGGNLKSEIYNNDFNATDLTWYRAIHLRSGTAVVFNNTIRGSFNTINVDNQRSNGQNTGTPFGACDGTSPWDGNLSGQAGYPCLDQIGRGAGQYPNQPLVPMYFWNNGASLGCSTGGSCVNSVNASGDGDAKVQANRDYYNNTVKPGYVPLVYPHPLAASGNTIQAPTGLMFIPNL